MNAGGNSYDNILTEMRFWQQVVGDSKRTVICSPDLESRCKGYVRARGMEHLIQVKPSPVCRDDQLLIIDEQALDTLWQRPIKFKFDYK